MVAVIGGLTRRAEEAANEDLRYRPEKVAERLRSLGVLLVVIESGARPGPRGAMGRAFPEFFEPLRGLSNADSAVAPFRTASAIEWLSHHLGCETAPSAGVDAFELVCHDDGSQPVMTAWSLGPRDKAGLVLNFHYTLARLDDRDRVDQLLARVRLFNDRFTAASASERAAIDEYRHSARRQTDVEQTVRQAALTLPAKAPPPVEQLKMLRAREDHWQKRVEELEGTLPRQAR